MMEKGVNRCWSPGIGSGSGSKKKKPMIPEKDDSGPCG